MAVYVLDTAGGRDWPQVVPESLQLDVVRGELDPEPQPGDVIVFHEEGGALLTTVQGLAQRGVQVVAVNEGGGEGEEVSPGFYRRRRGVGKPVDAHFRSCFVHFFKQLKATGQSNWALLEGPPAPDALIAYHLLGLLPEDAEAMAARRQLVGAALEEGKVIAEANELPTPTETEIQDRQYLRELLRR